MSSERSVKDLSGLYTLLLERAMGIEPTSEAWEALKQLQTGWNGGIFAISAMPQLENGIRTNPI